MSKVGALVRSWRAQGVRLNVGASPESQASLASFLGCVLPRDLSAFYEEADGMADGEMDSWGTAMWSIDRITTDRDVKSIDGCEWFAFGDILIDSWFLRMSVRLDRTVVLIESTREVFDDLDAFCEAYIDRPETLGLTRIK